MKVNFTNYIIGVVEGEIFPNAGDPEDPDGYSTWHDQTLKAQAVIARAYAFTHCGQWMDYEISPGVWITVQSINDRKQAYRPDVYADYEYLRAFIDLDYEFVKGINYTNAVPALYKSYTHDPTTFFTKQGTDEYASLLSVYDPVSSTSGHLSHPSGVLEGLGQNSADHWSRGESHGVTFPQWNWEQILAHYYPRTQLLAASGGILWPSYRWNAIRIYGTIFRTWDYDVVHIKAQNTGTVTWEANTKLSAYWRRCKRFGDFSCESFDPLPRPEAGLNNPETITVGQYDVTGVDMWLKPPTGFYDGENKYFYYLRFDMRRPNGQYFAPQFPSWYEQQWKIAIQTIPPKPKPSNPPCTPRCPTPQSVIALSWTPEATPLDPVKYIWRNQTQTTLLKGETENLSLAFNLERGDNTISLKTRDKTTFQSESQEVVIGRFFYDPDAPIITSFTDLPEWSNAQSVNLTWDYKDADENGAIPSGIASAVVEQQINGGAWTTLTSDPMVRNYQVNVLNNTDYTFRLTVRDHAGNVQPATRTVRIDQNVPTATLIAPTGTLTKTWTILQWNASLADGRSPVTFHIDRLVNGTWQTLITTYGTATTALFIGESNTTYEVRIWASDAAGNAQVPASTPQITFTTGADSSGLFKVQLPILLKTATINPTGTGSTTNTTNAYPPPQQ